MEAAGYKSKRSGNYFRRAVIQWEKLPGKPGFRRNIYCRIGFAPSYARAGRFAFGRGVLCVARSASLAARFTASLTCAA